MRPIPNGHPRTVRCKGDHIIELIFLSTMERDQVYEQLLKDLEPPTTTKEGQPQ